mgnify:CR=1 FL=1
MMNRDLFRQETLKPKNLGETLARLGGYFRRFWYMLLIVLVVIVVSTWTQVITPELMGQATEPSTCSRRSRRAGGNARN